MLIFALLFPYKTMAQHFQLEGNIKDERQDPVVGATVIVLSSKDSTHAAVGRTDSLGNFRLGGLSVGQYWFICSYLGYDPIQLDVELAGEPRTMILGEIPMKSNAVMLSTVQIVEKATPIIVRNDTMYYHAASFQTRPNAAVLELLKKLPGIQVRADGTIMAQGKEVQNILVDGKTFFNDDKLPTRVLEAEAIETVEVYDEASKMSDFTGVSDGKEERTINLILKEDRKKGWFGEARAEGGGSGQNDLRYNPNLNLNRFSPDFRAGLNGTLSNTGNIGGGFQRSQNLSGSLSQNLSPKLESSQNADLLNNRQQAKRTIRQQVFLPDGVQNSFEDNQSSSQNQSVSGYSSLSLQQDSIHMFGMGININHNRSENTDENRNRTFSGSSRQILGAEQNHRNSLTDRAAGSQLMWGKRLKKRGRVFLLHGNLFFSDNDVNSDIFSANTFFDENGLAKRNDTIRQATRQTGRTNQQGINFSFTEPIFKDRLLQVEYGFSRLADRSELLTFDKKQQQEIRNDSLSNKVRNQTLDHQIRSTVQYNWKKWQFNPGVVFQRSILQTRRNGLNDSVSKLNITRILPNLRAERSLGTTGSTGFSYEANQNSPDIRQLQAIPDRSDPLNVRVGNPGLRPEFRHQFSARANYFLPKKQVNLFGSTDISIVTNKIIETITLDSNLVRYFQPQNGRNEWIQNLSGSVSFPVKKWPLTVTLSGSLQFGESQAIVNEVDNKQKTRIFNQTTSLDFSPKDWCSVTMSLHFGRNLLDYSVFPRTKPALF